MACNVAAGILAALARDLLVNRRICPLTWGLAILRMVSGPLEAGPIGTSGAWHHLVDWLAFLQVEGVRDFSKDVAFLL